MNYSRILLAAIIATGAMTIFMLIAPFIGLPNMNVGAVLGAIFKGNMAAGWVLHFIAGIIFAFPYVFLFNRWLPVEHKIARGAIYGILLFVVSEIVFAGVNVFWHLDWVNKEDMAKMVFGDALACMIYGAVLGIFVDRIGSDAMEDTKRHA